MTVMVTMEKLLIMMTIQMLLRMVRVSGEVVIMVTMEKFLIMVMLLMMVTVTVGKLLIMVM
jgi:hypothetical protein